MVAASTMINHLPLSRNTWSCSSSSSSDLPRFRFLTISASAASDDSPSSSISSGGGRSKVNGSSSSPSSVSFSSVQFLSQKAAAVLSVASETSYALSGAVISAIQQFPQQIMITPTLPPPESHVDTLKQGRLVETVVYRQTFVVRSYEVGADRTATLDTFLNLFQETALNHVLISGLAGNGFGTTHEMIRNNLIWVVTRMQVQVEAYPAWGNALEIDTWVGASGKNGMRRDWLVRDYRTGAILARATSTWVMMHKDTRRLSKMPDAVRSEISPWFLERTAFIQESNRKIDKLDNKAECIRSGLTPRHSDLDMNQHVNNVKYLAWMMESLPEHVLESHQLVGITLEYRKECGKLDVVESLTQTEEKKTKLKKKVGEVVINGSSKAEEEEEEAAAEESGLLDCIHLLRMQTDGSEIVRSRTTWKSRL